MTRVAEGAFGPGRRAGPQPWPGRPAAPAAARAVDAGGDGVPTEPRPRPGVAPGRPQAPPAAPGRAFPSAPAAPAPPEPAPPAPVSPPAPPAPASPVLGLPPAGPRRGGGRRRAARPTRPPDHEPVFTAFLVAAIAALGWVSTGHWRQGLLGLGVVALAASAARLLLPTRLVGLLAVRGRIFDVVMLAALAVAIVGLTLAVPLPKA